ncbi:MAG: 2-hydroxychromene-2-carboxylate isomerase [Deltaproteobacteria bacterium]|nr:2-hydroxychromene-2-carboxylate isomerase [Deltaproteobacteria bacterium]
MPASFDFYYDLVSPYSYLAATQIKGLCDRTGAHCRWRPFFLGGVMQATGNKPPLQVYIPPKQKWAIQDLADWADYYGVPFRFPAGAFPFNTLTVQRMLTAVGEADETRVGPFSLALYRALWAEGKTIESPEIFGEIAGSLGLDGAQLLARASDPVIKEKLKSVTDEAVRLGAFGAPTFVVGSRLYWGNDRLPIVEKALSKQG